MTVTTAPRRDQGLRLLTAGAVLFVAAVAAVVSFLHIEALALAHGQPFVAAVLLPLSIDVTVVASSLVMLRAARAGIAAPRLARFMLVLAVAATLAANVGYGSAYGLVGALISGWPAVAFIGCAEMAIGMVRKVHATAPESTENTPAAALVAPVTSAPAAASSTPRRPGPRPVPSRPRDRSRTQVTPADAEREFAAELAAGKVPSVRQVKTRMRVGHPRAQALRDHLETVAGERAAA